MNMNNQNLSSKQQQQKDLDKQLPRADVQAKASAGIDRPEAARDLQRDADVHQRADISAKSDLIGAKAGKESADWAAKQDLSQAQAAHGISRTQAWNQESLAQAPVQSNAQQFAAQDKTLGQQAKAGVQRMAENIGQLATDTAAKTQASQAQGAQLGQEAKLGQSAQAQAQKSGLASQQACAQDTSCAQKTQASCAQDPACAQKKC